MVMGIYEILSKYKITEVGIGRILGQGLLFEVNAKKEYRIALHEELDLRDRVVTFLHEVLHLDPERDPNQYSYSGPYNPELSNLWRMSVKALVRRNQKYTESELCKDSFKLSGAIEDAIDEEATKIYNSQPNLVRYIISRYNLNRFPNRT